MKKYILLLLLFLLVPTLIIAEEPQGDITVTAVGEGADRQGALLQAKRAAVENGIGTIIQSETEVKNFMLKKDIILTRTIGAIKSIKILSEKRTDIGTYEVKIRSVVSLAGIKEDLVALRILLETMDKPRMMVLVRETHQGKTSSEYKTAETEIIDYLIDKEFNLVDPAQIAALEGKDDLLIERASNGNVAAAAKLGAANGADVILVGKVSGSIGEGSSVLQSLSSGQADISIKVITCATGKIITAKNVHAAKVHNFAETAINSAVKAASKKVMDEKVFEKIVASWQDVINNGRPVLVTVSGVKNFKTLKAVKKKIANADSDVVKVFQRGFRKPMLHLEVLYKGTIENFCESVDDKTIIAKRKMSVIDYTANSVKLEID